MTLRHGPVVVGGKRMGDMVTLDTKVVFYTTDPALAHLDGKRFESAAAVDRAVREALKKAEAA